MTELDQNCCHVCGQEFASEDSYQSRRDCIRKVNQLGLAVECGWNLESVIKLWKFDTFRIVEFATLEDGDHDRVLF